MLSATSVSGLLTFILTFYLMLKKDKNKVIGNIHNHLNSPL